MKGLRVLMFGMKNINGETDGSLEEDNDVFEKDIELLGITGLEDMLQDNVQTCIQ